MGFSVSLKTQWPLLSSTAWMWSGSMLCSPPQPPSPFLNWIPTSFIPSTSSNCFYFVAQYWVIQKMFVHWPVACFRKTAVAHISHGFFNEERVCCGHSLDKGWGSRHTTTTRSALMSYSIVYSRGIWEMTASNGLPLCLTTLKQDIWRSSVSWLSPEGGPKTDVKGFLSSLRWKENPALKMEGPGIWTIGLLSFPQIISIGSNLCALPHFATTAHSWPNLPQNT